MTNHDQMAAGLLRGNRACLRRLAKRAQEELENRIACPECGDRGPHEDNGRSGWYRSYCCRECGTQFDAAEL